jgi:rSAM/selenodomain-associated transferase 2
MRISVVMPTLNEERLLPKTLRHLTGLGIHEVIVVDGGSRDHTREIAASFSSLSEGSPSHASRIKVLTSSPGRAAQMNAGAAASHGDVLLFLHADTQLPHDALQAIASALEDRACVGGRFDVLFVPDTAWGRLIGHLMNLRSRWTGIATGDQAIFVRRDVFERLGGFSDLPIMEDIEFSRRLKRAGRMAALRETVVTSYRRWSASGPLRTILLMWCLRSLYWMGISPHRLRHFYGEPR